ncbi:MAG: hypothetical protein HY872_16070 [Chloroflexi bacterium]|nr:hypothetical protein [Chloroflexota bacterium]
MTLPQFFLTYDAYSEQTLSAFEATLQGAPTKVISDVTIGDLCSMEYPNGLYFFFDGNPRKLQYVGKCTSRSFVERVPAHFDQREGAWFNTLPTKLAQKGHTYGEALAKALQFHVLLLGIRDAGVAKKLERVFRHSYKPILNTPKNPRPFDANRSLAQLADT